MTLITFSALYYSILTKKLGYLVLRTEQLTSETSVRTRGADLTGEALLFSLLGKALYEDLDKTWLVDSGW